MSSNPHAEPGTRFWSPRTWSLRVRLLVTLVALLAVVCAAIGVATELALHRFLMHELDTQLLEAGRRSAAIYELPPMPMRPPHPGVRPMPPGDSRGAPPGFGNRARFDPEEGPGPGFLISPGQATRTVGAVMKRDGSLDAGVITSDG